MIRASYDSYPKEKAVSGRISFLEFREKKEDTQ